jgi:predicted hydrocarbon binding protein
MRRPRGYVGRGHETIGSDLLAVLGVVSMPKHTLGDALHRQLLEVQPGSWYSIELLLELMDTLEQRVGVNALRQMGRKLFQLSHEEHVKQAARSAAEVLGGFDDLYNRANRGDAIGGWKVLEFKPGCARLEKTTPHHCALEEGIVTAALACVGVPATVSQEQCFRKGAESCVFVMTSVVTDQRWGRLS